MCIDVSIVAMLRCRYESTEFHWRLQACGIQPQSLMYKNVGHADFVTDWHPDAPTLLSSLLVGAALICSQARLQTADCYWIYPRIASA